MDTMPERLRDSPGIFLRNLMVAAISNNFWTLEQKRKDLQRETNQKMGTSRDFNLV